MGFHAQHLLMGVWILDPWTVNPFPEIHLKTLFLTSVKKLRDYNELLEELIRNISTS